MDYQSDNVSAAFSQVRGGLKKKSDPRVIDGGRRITTDLWLTTFAQMSSALRQSGEG